MAFYAVHLKCGCMRGLTHAPNPDDLNREYYCTDHSWQPVNRTGARPLGLIDTDE